MGGYDGAERKPQVGVIVSGTVLGEMARMVEDSDSQDEDGRKEREHCTMIYDERRHNFDC